MRFAILIGLLCVTPAWADLASGPAIGDKVEKLPAYGVVGLVEDKAGDYIAERKDDATIFVFIQREKFDRPMARFLRKLDADIAKFDAKGHVVVVFLGDQPDEIKRYLPLVQQSLKFENTSLSFFEGEKAGPNGWGINADAHLTATIVKGKKVVASYGYQSVNETDAEKLIGKK